MPPRENTKLMDTLSTHLKAKGLSEGTINLYMTKLVKINGNKPFTALVFLKDFKKVKVFLMSLANENTRKSYITAIVSILNNVGKTKEYMTANILYKAMMNKSIAIANEPVDAHEMTEKQKENWLEWVEIMKKQKELETATQSLTKEDMAKPSNKKLMMHYLLLSLYTLTPPRRNLDYILMKLDLDGKKEDENFNYYDPKQKTFTFNVFKTKWKYGKEVIPCPLPLCNILDRYVDLEGIGDNDMILFKDDEKRLGAHITKTLNNIFGKKIGATMLRHFYDTHKYGAVLKGMQEDAFMMGHSVQEQGKYVKYPDAENKIEEK